MISFDVSCTAFRKKEVGKKICLKSNPVFCVCMTIAFHDGNNPKQNVSVNLNEIVLAGAAFGKITAVYGQITENYLFVRKMRFAYGQISKKWHFVRKFE